MSNGKRLWKIIEIKEKTKYAVNSVQIYRYKIERNKRSYLWKREKNTRGFCILTY